jgi:hypothetical protein
MAKTGVQARIRKPSFETNTDYRSGHCGDDFFNFGNERQRAASEHMRYFDAYACIFNCNHRCACFFIDQLALPGMQQLSGKVDESALLLEMRNRLEIERRNADQPGDMIPS